MKQVAQLPLALAILDRLKIQQSVFRDFVLVLASSWMIALTAQLAIPLPFTPVPITGQTLGVMLFGAALGSNRGFLAVLSYLLQGGLGLPFFAGGASGWLLFAGPTGGYLVGFLAAAYFCGLMAENLKDRHIKSAIPAFVVAQIFIFGFGLGWLGVVTGFENLLVKGFYPFLPGLLIKSALAGLLLPFVWKQVR